MKLCHHESSQIALGPKGSGIHGRAVGISMNRCVASQWASTPAGARLQEDLLGANTVAPQQVAVDAHLLVARRKVVEVVDCEEERRLRLEWEAQLGGGEDG